MCAFLAKEAGNNKIIELDNLKKQEINNKKLNSLEIYNQYQLLHYYPRLYEYRYIKFVSEISDGDSAVILGNVENIKKSEPKRGLNRTDLFVRNIGDEIIKATFFNEKLDIAPGEKILVYGKAKVNQYEKRINVKDYHKVEDNIPPFTGIKPVYQRIKGVSSDYIKQKIYDLFKDGYIEDFLTQDIKKNYKLMDLDTALREIHAPKNTTKLNLARYRLAFDEMFLFHVAMRLNGRKQKKQYRHNSNNKLTAKLLESLPFTLTNSQEKAWRDIQNDMTSEFSMKRLLLGDVGSGKTIVALLALLKSVESNQQGIIMAPTETLARQHYHTVNSLLGEFNIKIALNVSAEKHDMSDADIVIGTHALFSEGADYSDPGIVIIDEQHRFGVEQRAELVKKANNPDLLVMTATPIPRTLALTLYGDLDLTVIDEMPRGRLPVKTGITTSEDKTIEFTKQELHKGRQAYIVCPLIDESEKLDLQSARELQKRIQYKLHPFKVSLLHGQMKPEEKEEVMTNFKQNEPSVLVSTTVVEVGIDVPNATVMAIFEADRFGLAQLHQLRGRVGRGKYQSYCICVAPKANSEKAKKRLKAFAGTNDGYKLSEFDLQLRGAGEVFGSKQSGLYDFKLASLLDKKMVAITKEAAEGVKITESIKRELYCRYSVI